ncbi:MAG: eL32 family ribosomal protein [Candidatus Woesearchaeota archaeon]
MLKMINKELLELKRKMKKKMPKFKRQDGFKKKEVRRTGWRKPRGHHSKIKHNFRGYAKKVRSGYRTPKELRNRNNTGLLMANVYNINDLTDLSKDNIAIISKSVSLRKKLIIAEKAKENGITTIPSLDKIKTKYESLLKSKEEKKKIEEEKKKKKSIEEKVKKSKEEIKEDKGLSEEEKKEKEKKEKDKILITKD